MIVYRQMRNLRHTEIMLPSEIQPFLSCTDTQRFPHGSMLHVFLHNSFTQGEFHIQCARARKPSLRSLPSIFLSSRTQLSNLESVSALIFMWTIRLCDLPEELPSGKAQLHLSKLFLEVGRMSHSSSSSSLKLYCQVPFTCKCGPQFSLHIPGCTVNDL